MRLIEFHDYEEGWTQYADGGLDDTDAAKKFLEECYRVHPLRQWRLIEVLFEVP